MQTPENTKIKSTTIDGNPVDIHYKDCIYTTAIFNFSLIDRIRILFGRNVTYKRQFYTTQEVVIVHSEEDINVAPIFKRRAKTPQYAYVDVPVGVVKANQATENLKKLQASKKESLYNLTLWQWFCLIPIWLLWLFHDSKKRMTFHEVMKGMEPHEHKYTKPFFEHGYHFLQCEHEGCKLCEFDDADNKNAPFPLKKD